MFLVFLSPAQARESFNFSIGNNIHVLSDKAFRNSKTNEFEAVGNVIITQDNNAIYGEKASVKFSTGDAEIKGNVRYIGPNLTLYGSQMSYNFKDGGLSISNARVLSDNYVVLGEKLTRTSSNEIIAKNAEYTTCKDCPESWSVFGHEIRVTIGEYIRIKHAFLKVKGVVVMYIPYIVLPIKQDRETGFLFPGFGFDLDEGVRFQLPWFWAVSDSSDLTLTPSVYGRRGLGNIFQYRQVIADGLWFETNSLHAMDRIFLPDKEDFETTGGEELRHFTEWEHHFFSGKNITHHAYYNFTNDLDIIRDYPNYTRPRVQGSDFGGGGFFDLRSDYLAFSAEAYFNRNQLYSNTKGFDHRYVQKLPKLSLSSIPIRLFQSSLPGLNNLSFSFTGDATVFKQNRVEEGVFIRNATRFNLRPELEWGLGRIGPIKGKTKATLDYQHYRFRETEAQRSFTKGGVIYETEFALEIDRIFGLAYKKDIPIEKILVKDKKRPKEIFDQTIGDLPSIAPRIGDKKYTHRRNAYRHSQAIKLKHYFLSNQEIKGNERFANQIQESAGVGQFDPIDAVREREFELTDDVSRTTLPLNNTVEIQWNHSIIRKKAREGPLLGDGKTLRDHFDYQKIAFFNLSQGYDFNVQEEGFANRLTRLFIETGVNVDDFSFSLSEYYFYTDQEHIFRASVNRDFDRGSISGGFNYDTINSPVSKIVDLNMRYELSDLFEVNGSWEFDFEQLRSNRISYGLLYSPYNNCWKAGLGYQKTLNDKRITFNFLINFNENSFTSLSGL